MRQDRGRVIIFWRTSESMGYNLFILCWYADQSGAGYKFSSCNGELGERLSCQCFRLEPWTLAAVICHANYSPTSPPTISRWTVMLAHWTSGFPNKLLKLLYVYKCALSRVLQQQWECLYTFCGRTIGVPPPPLLSELGNSLTVLDIWLSSF